MFILGLKLAVDWSIENKLREEFNKKQLNIFDHISGKKKT